MIREDRELLAELARLNTDMVPLAMRMMDGSAHAAEQALYAQRLIAAGEWLQRRANEVVEMIIEGEVLAEGPLTLPTDTVKLIGRCEQRLGNTESADYGTRGQVNLIRVLKATLNGP